MIQALLNFFGLSQTATVALFVVFLVIAVGCGAADTVFIVKERKRRASERSTVSDAPVTEEEPAQEEVVAEQAVAQEEYVPEESDDEDEEALSGDSDEGESGSIDDVPVIVTDAAGGKITIRYNRSFTAKLIMGSSVLKNYYSIIKNELLRYGVKSRISWRHETFRKGRKLLAKIAIRGKTLYLYLALNPEEYANTKFKIRDASSVSANSAVPTLFRIKNDRRCRYSKQLIAQLMEKEGLAAGEEQNVDYAAQYPAEDLQALIDKNLVTYTEYVA